MSTATPPVSCMEEHPSPEESLELVNDDTPSYPDNWPLPPTPLPSCPGSSKDGEDMEPTPTGAFTPPLQRPTPQLTPPMSSSNNTRPLRSLSNPLAKSNHRKRLSLSFPIATSARNVSSVYTSPNTPTTPTEHDQLSPNDSMAFLTALATQERRVLELREELSKAESELTKLKRQWSIREATKKRHELLQTEIIRGAGIGDAVEGWKGSPIDESEARRRAALAKLTQAGTRGVNGQRHHRTLSLLSPQRTSNPLSFPQPQDLQDADGESVGIPTTLRRSDTLPNPPTRPLSVIETSNAPVGAAPGVKRNSQEVLLRTGKQMAEGFKEGLWAFVEDLKHATVGEGIPNGSNGAPSSRCSSSMEVTSGNVRKKGSKNSLRSMSNSERGKSPDSWQENGPISTSSSSLRWSTASTTLSETSSVSTTHSRSSTPRTSTSSVQSSNFTVGGVAGAVPVWGTVISVGTQFNLKKAAGAMVRGLETALDEVLALNEEDLKVKQAKETGEEKRRRREDQITVEAEKTSGRMGSGVLRRRSVRAAEEAKSKVA